MKFVEPNSHVGFLTAKEAKKSIIWNSSLGVRNYKAGHSVNTGRIFEIDLSANIMTNI